MEPVLTASRMRDADEDAIRAGTPAAVLMDRAAFACATVALRMLGGAYGRRVVVVAGKGNNGGDGIACAAHLARAGALAELVLLEEPSGEAAAEHLRRARAGSVRVSGWSPASLAGADLVVDAVLGTGLRRAPAGSAAEAVAAMARADVPVLAVDIPSGVSGEDGSVPGAAVDARVTVAIQSLKVGHVTGPGSARCGRVDVADVGIPIGETDAHLPDAADLRDVLPARTLDAHKYSAGGVAIVAGSAGMTGAAVLAARAAAATGAGIVFVGAGSESLPAVESAVVEAVKVRLDEGLSGLPLDRVRALAVGPGIGRTARAVETVREALTLDVPIVVDADGLWALGEIGAWSRAKPTVLTPHEGEFARFTGVRPDDRLAAARELARRTGAVVHLKGRRAVTAAPDGRAWVNSTGSAALATAGTGDVLAGVVVALLAQGVEVTASTWGGALLHGLAGDVASSRLGQRSVVAGDVVAALPLALRRVAIAKAPAGAIRTVIHE